MHNKFGCLLEQVSIPVLPRLWFNIPNEKSFSTMIVYHRSLCINFS